MVSEAILWTLAGPTVSVVGKTRIKTSRPTLRMSGTSTNDSKVEVIVGKSLAANALGTNGWTQTARLKKGVNRVTVQSVNSFGDLSTPAFVKVTRR